MQRGRRALLRWTLAALLPVCSAQGFPCAREARAEGIEAKIKVAYVYNFLKFIEWPGEKRIAATEPIRICAFGADPIQIVLGQLSTRRAKDRPIEVARIKDPHALSSCHLLYISRSEDGLLLRLLQQIEGKPVLTVSDIPKFAHRGGMIGFLTEKDRVGIEINQRSVQRAGLKARAKLLEIARIVR